MKLNDGDKFMKWLHKIRKEEDLEARRIGLKNKREKDLKIVEEIIHKYNIPLVRI